MVKKKGDPASGYYEVFKEHFISLCQHNPNKWYTAREAKAIININVTEQTYRKYLNKMKREKLVKDRRRAKFGPNLENEFKLRDDKDGA